MVTKEILINSHSWLDAKPVAKFIQKASGFKSSIWVEKDERKANAKSLLGVLSLGLKNGTVMVITVEGEDEEKAIFELEEYVQGL